MPASNSNNVYKARTVQCYAVQHKDAPDLLLISRLQHVSLHRAKRDATAEAKELGSDYLVKPITCLLI